ncbi:MAG: sulfide/dihydroorotate dehydrogenase-like FAD/NAD-binding protein [Candidatus Odinarchaeia archaeon]
MNKILEKEEIAPTIIKMKLKTELGARNAQPGQFLVLRIDEKGERIPLTLYDWNSEEGTVTVIFKVVGLSTKKLSELNVGDEIADILSPLGNPSIVLRGGKVIFVAGGVGAAPIVPIVKKFKKEKNDITVILGATTKELLILEDELREISDHLYVCTDDGTYGEKGFTTTILSRILSENANYDLVFAVGPLLMMKFVCEITKKYEIPTRVSLNSIMVDGTGMCGSCRCKVGGETKFTCIDGAEFDGHAVDFEELTARMRTYLKEEKLALERYEKMKAKGGVNNI